MGLHHRKVLEEFCTLICHVKDASCFEHCTTVNPPEFFPPPSPPINIDGGFETPSKSHNISTVLIAVVALLSAGFVAACCYAVYAKFFRKRRTVLETEESTRGDFLDGEHGPMIEHPIWYIRTPGLQQAVISAITVCKYKKGEGLIEGTECSVCLSEFEEGEDLRLLPKCNHAFHLPCIDTWLRSHTNCPLCRAPIVQNPTTTIATPEPNLVNSRNTEETQIEIGENRDENAENSVAEGRNGGDEDGGREMNQMVVEDKMEEEFMQGRRRSVSLDSSAVEKVNRALAVSVESSSASKRVSKGGSSSFRIRSFRSVAGTSMKRSSSYNGKLLLSRNSRSQRKPSGPVRSF